MSRISAVATSPQAATTHPPVLRDQKFFEDLKTSKADGFYGAVSSGGIQFTSGISFHGRNGFVNVVGITAGGAIAYSAQNRPGHKANPAELKLLAAALDRTAKGTGVSGDARMKKAIESTAAILERHAKTELRAGTPAPLSASETRKLDSFGWE